MSAAQPTRSHMPIPSLLYGDVEDDLRATARDLLARRCPWQQVLARIDTPDKPYDDDLWATLAGELGVTALLVPQQYGGAGATAREAAVVLEELGRAVAPVPYLASAVLATTALTDCAADGNTGAETALRALADGSATATLAVTATSWPQAPFPGEVTGSHDADANDATALVLTGALTHVLAADRADLLVVPVRVDGAAHLALVDTDHDGVTVRPRTVLDVTRPLADVLFDGVPARLLAQEATAERVLRHTLTVAAALLASEQLGTAEQALETAVAYLGTRHQFGRPIGSFQSLRHRAADLWSDLATARATARYAAACVAENSDDLPVAAALAQSYLGEVVVHTAEECVQMHGGIGFTWEHPAHLYLKRAASSALLLGTGDRHRAALAELVDLPG